MHRPRSEGCKSRERGYGVFPLDCGLRRNDDIDRHTGESRYPEGVATGYSPWIAAFAAMTWLCTIHPA
jgi:hypothetical protein